MPRVSHGLPFAEALLVGGGVPNDADSEQEQRPRRNRMAAVSGAAPPQGGGAPKRPIKALTLRIVTGLGSDEEVMDLFARDLRPGSINCPSTRRSSTSPTQPRTSAASASGNELRGCRSPARRQSKAGPGASSGPGGGAWMYWFVIFAVRPHTGARPRAPRVGPPQSGSWLECPYPSPASEEPARRYTTILTERGWAELCKELGLDFEQVCREEGRSQVCEAGPLPALSVDQQPADLPGITAVAPDVRECVVGPLAAIALELATPTARRGAATDLEVGLCVAPLPEKDAERKRIDSLFAAVAFNVGGFDAELRCPDCSSPELRWLSGPNLEEQMGCGNCGTRLARESAFLRLGDCEEILATAPPPALATAAAVPGSL
jgi:hypothetical protein